MDKNAGQGKGPQGQDSWKKRWDKVSRTLGRSYRSETHKEHRMEEIDSQKRRPVEEFLKGYKDNPVVIGFKGWTKEKYQEQVDLAFNLADDTKNRSFSDYSRFALKPTGKYEVSSLRIPDKNASRVRNTGETDYRGSFSDFDRVKEELESHIKDVDILKSEDFNKIPAQERYNKLELFSRLYIQEMKAVLPELGATDRQFARDSIRRCERYRNSAERSMNQWRENRTDEGQNPPFYVDGNLRLLRRSTEQQLRALEKISRGESLQEQNQLGTLREKLQRASNVEDRSHIISEYYDTQVEKVLLLNDNSKKLWKNLPAVSGREALRKEVSSVIKKVKISDTMKKYTWEDTNALKELSDIDRSIEALSRINEQLDRTQLSTDWVERYKEHLKQAILPEKREQEYENIHNEVKQAREQFFTAATDNQNRGTALSEYQIAVDKYSKFTVNLMAEHYLQLENQLCP